MASSTGRAVPNARSLPPAMIASVPSAAPIAPPLTGASSSSTSCLPAVISSWRGESGATVECTATTSPARAVPSAAPEHVTDLVVVAHHHAEHVDAARELGHAPGRRRPDRDQLGHRRLLDVEDAQLVLARRQPQRHRLADVAQPDETDPHARNVCPPSTARIWPVTQADSSDSR